MLKRLRPKVVICEEAGEVMEPHLVSSLMHGVEHFIQIGDHRQLRPQIMNYSLSLRSAAGQLYQLDRSQFERRAMGEPECARRPWRSSTSNGGCGRKFQGSYGPSTHSSKTTETVKRLPNVVGTRKNVFWLDHRNMEDSVEDQHRLRSHSNDWEVRHDWRLGSSPLSARESMG